MEGNTDYIIPDDVRYGMVMVKNEGVRAMAVVQPGPTSLTPRKKSQTRSEMGITRLVLHTNTLKDSLECTREASAVKYKSFRSKFHVFQLHIILGRKTVPADHMWVLLSR